MFTMPRRFLKTIFSVILAAFVITGAVLLILYVRPAASNIPYKNNQAGSRILEIRDAVSGRIYGQWSLEGTDEFAIEFVHSVNQGPVREAFICEGGMIRPQAVRFSSFGAGMLSDVSDGLVLGRDGDAMVISGFNTTFKELNYIVGTVSDHLFFFGDEIISLRDLCGKNAHITIRIRE